MAEESQLGKSSIRVAGTVSGSENFVLLLYQIHFPGGKVCQAGKYRGPTEAKVKKAMLIDKENQQTNVHNKTILA